MRNKRVVNLQENGFSNRFENRPEFLFGTAVARVIDANVREHSVGGLVVTRVENVFSSNDEFFLVLGKPNASLVVGKEDGSGFERFSAYSLWRKPSVVEYVTREHGSFVQSGIWLRMKNIPEEAKNKLREGMIIFSNKKFRTCVHGNMQVMDYAGFTSGGRKLTRLSRPSRLMSALVLDGLEFDSKKIEVDIIRTTRLSMEDYKWRLRLAEFTTLCRHCSKTLIGSWINYLIQAPYYLFTLGSSRTSQVGYEVAPALPSDIEYLRGIQVRVTTPGTPGQILRQVFGPHAFFESSIDRVNVDEYFHRALKPFPQKKPSLMTRIKKYFLFSPLTVQLIRSVLGTSRLADIGERDERDVYDMLRTHSDTSPNVYNLVVVRTPAVSGGSNPTVKFIIARITVRTRFIDWILSKHVLMSGYLWYSKDGDVGIDPKKTYVVWAGEIKKTNDGILDIVGNSGTFQPSDGEDDMMIELVKATFPHLKVRKGDR